MSITVGPDGDWGDFLVLDTSTGNVVAQRFASKEDACQWAARQNEINPYDLGQPLYVVIEAEATST